MRALLLAAGFGTRLRPLTDTVPNRATIGPLLINTHYLSEVVEAFIADSPYRSDVTLTHEMELKGTAGTLINHLGFFDGGDAMLIHADNYCLADLSAFVRAHHERPAECLMTMMTFRATNPKACGIVETDARGVVIGFHEKVDSPPGNTANGGVYILSSALLALLGAEFKNATDFSTQIIPHFVGRIYGYHTAETFLDIGTPETYAAANER